MSSSSGPIAHRLNPGMTIHPRDLSPIKLTGLHRNGVRQKDVPKKSPDTFSCEFSFGSYGLTSTGVSDPDAITKTTNPSVLKRIYWRLN